MGKEGDEHTNYYKRYIYKNGVKHGPYYYTNKKIDGKVVSTYLGTKKPTHIKHSGSNFQIKNIKLAIIITSVIILALIIFLFQSLDIFSTGNLIKAPDSTSIIRSIDGEFDVDFGDDTNDSLNDTNSTYIQEPFPVIKEVKTFQGEAILGESVFWEKEIILDKPGSVSVEIPVDSKNIKVYRINEKGEREEVSEQDFSVTARASAEIVLDGEESPISKFFKKIIGFFTGKAITIQEEEDFKKVIITDSAYGYEIEYETPTPIITEEDTDTGKIIILSSEISYADVITFTELDENLNIQDPGKVRILWVEGNEYIMPELIDDKNLNGIYDYIEFIAPSSDNQTFIIIVITHAEHLDENKTFINDIYEQVKELDDVFSEEIPEQHYVRVIFERNLTSANDITVFPKIARGSPKIEIYEKDKDILIAEFTNIVDNEYNKVFLTSLEGEQDTFDLKIVNGSVLFDHIIDPLVLLFYDTFTAPANTLLTSHFPNTGNSWNQAWTSGGNLRIESNGLQHSGGNSDGGIGTANPSPSGNNYAVSALYAVADSGDDTSTLVLRWVDVNNFYSFRWSTTASQSVINKRVGGTCTVLNSACPSPSGGQTIRFEASGNTLSVYYNNVLACTATDTSLTSPGTGGAGIGATPCDINNDVSAQRLDNFNMSETTTSSNSPPTINYVETISSQNPVESSVRDVIFEIRVADLDGVSDINDSSVNATFSKAGEQSRFGSCVQVSDIDSTTTNYSCTVGMQYYDGPGVWNIIISARDNFGNSAISPIEIFTYNELKAITINQPSSLTWPTLTAGQTNILSNNDPTVINNTGNYQGAILMTARDLVGQTNPSQIISVSNFRAGPNTGSECSAAQLQNATQVSISGSSLPRGPSATEEIYYCLTSVPSVTAQSYSAQGANAWTIEI